MNCIKKNYYLHNIKLFTFGCLLTSISLSYALTYSDTDFLTPMSTGLIANTLNGDIIINTTSSVDPVINTTGDGFLANDQKNITINNQSTFTIYANTGVRVFDQSVFTAYGAMAIDVTGNNGRGMYFVGNTTGGQGIINGSINITTAGIQSIGLMAYNAGHAEFNNTVNIITTGENNYGIAVQKTNPTVLTDPTLVFNQKVIIDHKNMGGSAITTQGISGSTGGKIYFNNGLEVKTLNAPTVVSAVTDGEILIKGMSYLESIDKLNFNVLEAHAGSIEVNGESTILGDMVALNSGKIVLHLTDESIIKGNTAVNPGGVINLSLTGANSQWHMSQNSALTHLNLQSDAQVYLGDQTAQLTPSNQVILTVDELSGSGVFNMRTNIADGFADLVKVTGTANGVHGIMVSDQTTGGANVTGSEVIKLVEMMGGNAQFNLLNLNSQNINGIDIGAYIYQLSEAADVGGASNWVLSGGVLPSVTPPVEPPLTNTAKASISMLNINYLLTYAETQTLLQRMGELRDTESSGDVWSRVYGGKLNSFTAALESVDFNYSGFQLGLDQQVRNAYGDFYLGGMVGYSTGKAKYQVGKGDTRSYSMGIYGTYQNDDDLYIDGVLKYTNIRNQFNTYTSGGYKVFGKGTSSGLSASLELGKRFYFNDKKEGVYLEPQAQLVYSHQGATTVRSSNQLNTHLSSVDSLLGRVSLVAGYNLQESENPMSIYFKTGLIKEFKGKAEYAFNQGEFKSYRMDGHWWENGVGVTAQFKQQHNFYLEASHASGRKFNKLQLNVGYRFEF